MADHLIPDPDGEDRAKRERQERIAKENAELERVKKRIDAELRRQRPDRYQPGADWLDAVTEVIADEVPILSARQMAARTLVGQREGSATRRVNRFLKGLAGADGQYALPVDWFEYVDEPVAIEVRTVDADGQLVEKHRERVALRAMRSSDWNAFSKYGRINLEERHQAEIAMYDGVDWVAAEQGALTFKQWANRVAPRDESSGDAA